MRRDGRVLRACTEMTDTVIHLHTYHSGAGWIHTEGIRGWVRAPDRSGSPKRPLGQA